MSKKKTVIWSSPKELQSNTIPRKIKKRVRRPEWCTKYKGEHVYELYDFQRTFWQRMRGWIAFTGNFTPDSTKTYGVLYLTWKYRCTGCGRREQKTHSIIGEIGDD